MSSSPLHVYYVMCLGNFKAIISIPEMHKKLFKQFKFLLHVNQCDGTVPVSDFSQSVPGACSLPLPNYYKIFQILLNNREKTSRKSTRLIREATLIIVTWIEKVLYTCNFHTHVTSTHINLFNLSVCKLLFPSTL